jgi:pimeloyl-ACP methyl ester carboxylesterase
MPTITTSDGVRLRYVDEGAGRPRTTPERRALLQDHATIAAGSNPLARAVVFDDCGHAANLDQPDHTNAAILEFLR